TGYNIMFGANANPALFEALNRGKTMWKPMAANARILTDWAIEDGSFLRLSTLTLGYTLPSTLSQRLLMRTLRVYVAGYNLHVWTNYAGQDPEVDTRRSPLTPGGGYSAYPRAKKVLFGLNVTFYTDEDEINIFWPRGPRLSSFCLMRKVPGHQFPLIAKPRNRICHAIDGRSCSYGPLQQNDRHLYLWTEAVGELAGRIGHRIQWHV